MSCDTIGTYMLHVKCMTPYTHAWFVTPWRCTLQVMLHIEMSRDPLHTHMIHACVLVMCVCIDTIHTHRTSVMTHCHDIVMCVQCHDWVMPLDTLRRDTLHTYSSLLQKSPIKETIFCKRDLSLYSRDTLHTHMIHACVLVMCVCRVSWLNRDTVHTWQCHDNE